jgi:hypothetical protein
MSATNVLAIAAQALELRAVEQRRRLHDTVADLRETVTERADINKLARNHLWPVTGVAALVALIMGFGTGRLLAR